MSFETVPRSVSPWLLGVLATALISGCIGCALISPKPATPPASARVPTIQAVAPAALSTYAGNGACASCHPTEYKSHAASQHARAMSRVTATSHGAIFRAPSATVDPKRGVTYQTAVAGDKCELIAKGKNVFGVATAEFGFGSGRHGITYLGREEGSSVELRLSYYPGPNRWAFSPGQQLNSKSGGLEMVTGLQKPAETVEGCFVCHSTVIAKQGGQVLPESCVMGVGCESCHGPAKAHIEAVRHGDKDPHLPRLEQIPGPQLSVQLCGQCHRSPAGDNPDDPFNRSQLPRLQGLALARSLCFTNSNGRLSCLTCHDAHSQQSQSRTAYNARCGSCHGGATPTDGACRVDPTGDCVGCHMPAQSVGMPFGLKYRTHWIKVWGAG